MLVVSKDRTAIVNTNNIEIIYAGENGTIRTDGGTKSYKLSSYNTTDDAYTGMEMLVERMRNVDSQAMVFVPTQEEVDQRQKSRPLPVLHQTGKKVKGHGGS